MASAPAALTKDRTILDATSGNTGIAYAMIAAAKGYKVKLVLPANASHERKAMLKAYGAETILSDPAEGSDGAIRKCREIYENDPNRYFYPDQYNNPANWKSHFDTTAPRDHGTDRRSGDALHRGSRHQRQLHGNVEASEARPAQRDVHLRAAVFEASTVSRG